MPLYRSSGTSNTKNVGERPTGTQPNFPGSVPGFGVDHLPPRSPGREYYDISSCGFAERPGGLYNQPGLDNVHSWGTYEVHEWPRSFDMPSEPAGKPLRDHFRSGDMAGEDFIPSHLRRVDYFGPRNVPSHFHGVDGFGTFPDPRMGELTGHGGLPNASFVGNKSNHSRLGEPGFRGSFSLHGFSSSGDFYAVRDVIFRKYMYLSFCLSYSEALIGVSFNEELLPVFLFNISFRVLMFTIVLNMLTIFLFCGNSLG